jgi:hypothetical protein
MRITFTHLKEGKVYEHNLNPDNITDFCVNGDTIEVATDLLVAKVIHPKNTKTGSPETVVYKFMNYAFKQASEKKAKEEYDRIKKLLIQ